MIKLLKTRETVIIVLSLFFSLQAIEIKAQDSWVLQIDTDCDETPTFVGLIDGVSRTITAYSIDVPDGIISGIISSRTTVRESYDCSFCRVYDDVLICDENNVCVRSRECMDYVERTCTRTVTTCTASHSISFNNTCGSSGGAKIGAAFYRRINTPTSTGLGCGGLMLSTTSSSTSYKWEVTDNPAIPSRWREMTGKTTKDITIVPSDLTGLNLSNNLSARVSDPSCANRVSTLLTGLRIYLPAPTFDVNLYGPSCNGGDDGRIVVSNPSGGLSGYRVTLVFEGQIKYQLPVSTSTFPLTILKSDIAIPPKEIKSGAWTITVQNNDSDAQKGDCGTTKIESVPITPLFNLSLPSSTPVSCNSTNIGNVSDGTITLSVGNGVSPFTYLVSKDGGAFAASSPNDATTRSPIFSGLTKGNYKFIATDANTCTSTETAVIPIAEPPIFTLSNNLPTDVLCKGKATGAIDLNVGGGNGGYTYSWSAAGLYAPYVIPSTEDISGIKAGTYNATVTDSKGCRPAASPHVVTIIEPSADFIATATKVPKGGGFDMTCAQNDGEVTLVLANETGALTGTWTKNAIPFTPTALLNPEGLTPGVYSVTIVDGNNCDASASVTLSPHPGITVVTQATSNFNGYNTKCPTSNEGAGEVSTVTNGFGTLNYVWPNATVGAVITDLVPGTYNVTVTDGNGCSDSENLIITAPPAIQPRLQVTSNFNGAQISCPSATDGSMETFPLNGFGSYTYEWGHDADLVTSLADHLSQGTYIVKVTDSYGCFVTQSLGINDPAPMNLTLTKKSYNGSDLSCHDVPDGEILLAITNGAAPYGYAWSNGMNTQNIKDLPAGDYDVVVTDANGCTQPGITTILNPAPLALTIQHVNDFNGYDISCKGFSDGSAKAIPTGGTAPYFYSWSNGVVNDLNPGLTTGGYTIQVADANGCPNAGTITVTEPPEFIFSGSVDNPVSCFGLADGQVSLTSSGGVTPYEYSRDQLSWQSQAFFSSLNFGTKDFYSRDANGCLSSIQRVVPQPDPIAISFQNIIDARCNDPVGSAQAIATGGNNGFMFSWFDDSSNQSMNAGDVLQKAIAGIYRVEIKDIKNCAASDIVAVSSIGGAIFNVDNITPVSCFGFKDGASSVSVTSGIAPYSFLWSDGQTLPAASGLLAGRTFITVTDGLGCKTLKPVIIPTPDPLASQYNKALPLCVGDCNGQIKALPSGGTSPYQFDWVGQGISTDIVNNLCAGSYDLRVTDSHGCLFTEKIELKNPDPLKIIPQVVKPICLGRCDGSISVTGTGGTGPYRFDWDAGTNATSISNLCPGDYGLQMKDAHDCPINDRIILPAGDPLPLDLGSKATLCVGQSKMLDAGSNWVQSNWTSTSGFSETTPIVTIKDPGIYYFKGINSIGCIGLDTFRLETSLDLLKAEFLTPSEAIVGDTLVAIDISWPLPERVEWNYPTSWRSLTSPTPDVLIAQLPVAGTFTVGMRSFLAECRALREKTIIVLEKPQGSEAGRLGYTETALIREFTLFPNPNDGRFDVNVALSQERDIQLRIVQFPTGIIKSEFRGQSSSAYRIGFDLPDLAQGLYIVLLKVGGEEKFLRFFKK